MIVTGSTPILRMSLRERHSAAFRSSSVTGSCPSAAAERSRLGHVAIRKPPVLQFAVAGVFFGPDIASIKVLPGRAAVITS
jgi:hypothetical protein